MTAKQKADSIKACQDRIEMLTEVINNAESTSERKFAFALREAFDKLLLILTDGVTDPEKKERWMKYLD